MTLLPQERGEKEGGERSAYVWRRRGIIPRVFFIAGFAFSLCATAKTHKGINVLLLLGLTTRVRITAEFAHEATHYDPMNGGPFVLHSTSFYPSKKKPQAENGDTPLKVPKVTSTGLPSSAGWLC